MEIEFLEFLFVFFYNWWHPTNYSQEVITMYLLLPAYVKFGQGYSYH